MPLTPLEIQLYDALAVLIDACGKRPDVPAIRQAQEAMKAAEELMSPAPQEST